MAEARKLQMPTQCPMCESPLHPGLLLAPRGLFWDIKTHWAAILGETILSQWSSLKMPHIQAWRCMDCGLVLFSGPPAPATQLSPMAPGFRYACPGCGGDVYSSQTECPACGHLLPGT